MSRPKLHIKKSRFDIALEVLTFLLIIVSAVILMLNYKQLPEKLPIHFNWPSKDENGLGSKAVLWASPIICSVIAMAIYKLNHYPWVFNYPTDINEDNAKYHYTMATQMMRILSFVIGCLCFVFTVISILNGLGHDTTFQRYFDLIFPILLIGIPVFYMIKLYLDRKSEKKNL